MRYAPQRPVAPTSKVSGDDQGETALEEDGDANGGATGFRRVSPAPEPLALARLRALLLDAAASGTDLLREGVQGFQSWRFLATLCGSEWTAGTRQSTAAARRVLQRRLRVLGTRPVSLAHAAQLPVGSATHVRGTIRPMPQSRVTSHIWFHGAMNTDNVRFVVEEGHDFSLRDEAGETACVIAARGILINSDLLKEGDRVSVFGFTDRVADPRGLPPDHPARDASALALRSGDDRPLLLRLIPNTL
jgi:hypothetical protein